MEEILINTEYIKLDSAMKLANIAESGAYAKELILEGSVKVNGEVETWRGRKLYPGDEFSLDGETFKVKHDI